MFFRRPLPKAGSLRQNGKGVFLDVSFCGECGFSPKKWRTPRWKTEVFNNIPFVQVEKVENFILRCGKVCGKGEKLPVFPAIGFPPGKRCQVERIVKYSVYKKKSVESAWKTLFFFEKGCIVKKSTGTRLQGVRCNILQGFPPVGGAPQQMQIARNFDDESAKRAVPTAV